MRQQEDLVVAVVPAGMRGWWSRVSESWPTEAFTVPGEYAVELRSSGEDRDQRVDVVRAIRQVTGWSGASARHAMASTPVVLATSLSAGSAEAACRVLAEAGAAARTVRPAGLSAGVR